MRVWKKIPNCWRCAFFNSAQTVAATRENAFAYDEVASGSIIYTYVEGNPLIWIDPKGLDSAVNNAIGIILGKKSGDGALDAGTAGTVSQLLGEACYMRYCPSGSKLTMTEAEGYCITLIDKVPDPLKPWMTGGMQIVGGVEAIVVQCATVAVKACSGK